MRRELLGGAIIVAVSALLSLGGAWAMTARVTAQAQAREHAQREQLELLQARVASLERRAAASASPADPTLAASPSSQPPSRSPRHAGEPGQPGGWPGQPPDSPAGIARSGASGSSGALDLQAQPQVREAIQGLVRQQLDAERDQRDERRRERMSARTREEVAQLAKLAKLDQETEAQLAEVLVSERERMGELWRSVREGDASPEEVRQKMGELRAQTDQEAASMLDEEQLKLYQQQRAEQLERFMGRGPRQERGPEQDRRLQIAQ